jgi:acyl transferase domain-containing protein/acyl-CoA synthetase (AMP-forming)/AMP-acid ligase II/acyl carrier protein
MIHPSRAETTPSSATDSSVLRHPLLRALVEGQSCAARRAQEKTLFLFDDAGPRRIKSLSGSDVLRHVATVGAQLQAQLPPQSRVLVVLPQGLEFLCVLIACFEANVIAIPVPVATVARSEDPYAKLKPLLADSGAECIVTDEALLQVLSADRPAGVSIVTARQLLDAAPSPHAAPRSHSRDDVAILLYTSGSTAEPKGIALTHEQLLEQTRQGAEQWHLKKTSCVVSWTPGYHNVGLRFGFLSPLLRGALSVILDPDAVVRDPTIWLRAISHYGATHSAAPNFALDLCSDRADPEVLQGVSLASLQAVFCGGEPVRRRTYERFIARFAALGFNRNALCSHYGLSEVGSVTASAPGEPLRFKSLDSRGLEEGVAQECDNGRIVVSCGCIGKRMELLIVDPMTREPCAASGIGEVWIKGAEVASGYRNRPEETRDAFGGVLTTGAGGFLRTGDLGFVDEGHLYVMGRLKEIMIIHGRNHHPGDIEGTLKERVPELSLPLAVFSCDVDDVERVVAVQEVEGLEPSEYPVVARRMRAAVSEMHLLDLHDVILVEKGSVARTAGGKIQRRLCRRALLDGTLEVVYRARGAQLGGKAAPKVQASPVPMASTIPPPAPRVSPEEIAATLRTDLLPATLDASRGALADVSRLSELGLDSLDYVRVAARIEAHFGVTFDPTLLFKHRTLEEIAEYVAAQLGRVPTPATGDGPSSAAAVPRAIDRPDDVAIVGMSCHFPGNATSPETFWANLIGGVDCVSPISAARDAILCDERRGEAQAHERFPRHGGFIDNVDAFDAGFFGISRLEAECMDPQQRKMLELAWSVVESAGHNPRDLAGARVGVFVGAHNCDYLELVARYPKLLDTYGAHLDSGLHVSMIANRVSRWFDFRGPSESINTGCSSSLVAVHHAINALRLGQCDVAIAAGINLILSDRVYAATQRAGMLAADGRCKTFSSTADGFGRAEGYGAVLLKTCEQARRDNDRIHGVIRSAVINHDGRSNSLRAPNLNAQRELIEHAYREAGVPLDTVTYIEAHGTGTSLGDPIEIRALKEAFAALEPELPTGFCGLGSVKTNIGHCESAAGMAGLIKVLMAMRSRTLPGLLHFSSVNPLLALQGSPFELVERTREWRGAPLRAGVSSFGLGGVNAHVVLEEPPADTTRAAPTQPSALIVLSARTEERLTAQAAQLIRAIQGRQLEEADLHRVAYTLQIGREPMEHRLALRVTSLEELRRKLVQVLADAEDIADVYRGVVKRGKAVREARGADTARDTASTRDGAASNLLQQWVDGRPIDWTQCYPTSRPQRIALPTYPFAQDRYWIDVASELGAEPGRALPRANREVGGSRSAAALEASLARDIAASLGIGAEEIAVDAPLGELALDDRSRAEVVAVLNERHGLSLTPATLDGAQTVQHLARSIELRGSRSNAAESRGEPTSVKLQALLESVYRGSIAPQLAAREIEDA